SLDFIQSSMRIDDPFALDIAYTRKMMAFLLFVPKPDHVLMVGQSVGRAGQGARARTGAERPCGAL
ncbi:MAG: hypothetical protein M1449_01410, partial [Candidatus Thermoplasmatota archaeon]|nr:hypothetical protein [Candidatus Thermoplasmatota archaeon]